MKLSWSSSSVSHTCEKTTGVIGDTLRHTTAALEAGTDADFVHGKSPRPPSCPRVMVVMQTDNVHCLLAHSEKSRVGSLRWEHLERGWLQTEPLMEPQS